MASKSREEINDQTFIEQWVSANSNKFFDESIKYGLLKQILSKHDNVNCDKVIRQVEEEFEDMKKSKK